MKRQRNWYDRRASDNRTVGLCVMHYVRCLEEVRYQHLVTAYVHNTESRKKEGSSEVSLGHVMIECPFYQHWSFRKHKQFTLNLTG